MARKAPGKHKTKRTGNKRGALTGAQRKFCSHYALHGNAAEAYAKGYPSSLKHTPQYRSDKGYKLLTRAEIKAEIERLRPKALEVADKKFEITAERVLAEMAAIAFANADDYYSWGTEKVPLFHKNGTFRLDESGKVLYESRPFAHIRPSKDLTRQQKAAIVGASMTFSRTGDPVVEVKMADKRGALKDLMQHLGLLKQEVNLSGKGGGPVQLVISNAESKL